MKLPQIIRFSDYLKETPSEAVRTVPPTATRAAWIFGLCCRAKPSWWTTRKAAAPSAQAIA